MTEAKCRAKNPSTCRTHGTVPTSKPAEAQLKEFFGQESWDKVTAAEQEQTTGMVKTSLSKAFRDIENFSENKDHRTSQKLTQILTDTENRKVMVEGESSEAVMDVRRQLRENYDRTLDGGGSALATVRMFKDLKRSNELGDEIREQALLEAQKPAVRASFEAMSEGIVSLFKKHGVLGNPTGKKMDRQQRGFMLAVKEQATGKYSKKPYVTMYRESNVELSVKAHASEDKIYITNIQLREYDTNSSKIDHAGLAQDFAKLFHGEVFSSGSSNKR